MEELTLSRLLHLLGKEGTIYESWNKDHVAMTETYQLSLYCNHCETLHYREMVEPAGRYPRYAKTEDFQAALQHDYQVVEDGDGFVCPNCKTPIAKSNLRAIWRGCDRVSLDFISDFTQPALDFVGYNPSDDLFSSEADEPLTLKGYQVVRYAPDLILDLTAQTLTIENPKVVRVFLQPLGQKAVGKRVVGARNKGPYARCNARHALTPYQFSTHKEVTFLTIENPAQSALMRTGLGDFLRHCYEFEGLQSRFERSVDLPYALLYEQVRMQWSSLEQLSKAKLTNLVQNVLDSYDANKSLDFLTGCLVEASTPTQILGVNKALLKELVERQVPLSEFRKIKKIYQLEAFGTPVLQLFTARVNLSLMSNQSDTFVRLMSEFGFTVSEIAQYVERAWLSQALEAGRSLHLWVDYLNMAKLMEIPFDRFPRSLVLQHDVLARDFSYKKNAMTEKMFKQATEKNQHLSFEWGDFFVTLPKDVDDLVREGRTLHHCVASYVERVAEGKTTILFLRQKSDPNTPYVTMEWRDDHLAQAKGNHNHAATDINPKLGLFLTKWKAHALTSTPAILAA